MVIDPSTVVVGCFRREIVRLADDLVPWLLLTELAAWCMGEPR